MKLQPALPFAMLFTIFGILIDQIFRLPIYIRILQTANTFGLSPSNYGLEYRVFLSISASVLAHMILCITTLKLYRNYFSNTAPLIPFLSRVIITHIFVRVGLVIAFILFVEVVINVINFPQDSDEQSSLIRTVQTMAVTGLMGGIKGLAHTGLMILILSRMKRWNWRKQVGATFK